VVGKNRGMVETKDRTPDTATNGKTSDQGKETGMASTHGEDPMLRAHQQTYKGFVRLLTWSTIGVALALVLLAAFLL